MQKSPIRRNSSESQQKMQRERFQEIFIKDGGPRVLRQAERMGYEMETGGAESSGNREVPERNDDEEMPDAQEEQGNVDDDMVYCMNSGERSLNSLTPDEEVIEKIKRVQRDIENKKRQRKWNDSVEAMHREFAKGGIALSLIHI